MTTTRARLIQLEKLAEEHCPRPAQVFTVYSGPGTDDPDGSKLAATRAQAGPNDTIFVVCYDDEAPIENPDAPVVDIHGNPVTTITGPNGYQATVGIDAGRI